MDAPRPRRFVAEGAGVGLAAALLAARWWGLISRTGLTMPMQLDGDGLYHASLVTSMQRTGWYVFDPEFGFPIGRDMHDFPLGTDHLHLVLLKAISLLPLGAFTVVNLFFLLTTVLIAATTHAVLRAIGLRPSTSAVAAFLFTFLPYREFRGTGHLFLGNYVAVPLVLLLLHRLTRGELVHRRMGRGAILGTVACVVVVGSASPYYAAFAAILLVVAGLAEAARLRSRTPLLASLAVVAGVGVVFVLNISASLVNDLTRGANTEAAGRLPSDSDVLGIRLANLVAPYHHRLRFLEHFGQQVARVSDPVEVGGSYLGAVAVAGVAALVGFALLRAAGRQTGYRPLVGVLSVCTVVTLLLATKGGGSLLLANLGLAQIRGWNRMTVLLALFGITAMALVFDRRVRPRLERIDPRVALAVLAVVLVAGVCDQISGRLRAPLAGVVAQVDAAKDVTADLEAALPTGAGVFQLPYMRYPGNPQIGGVPDYSHFLLPIVGDGTLRWSYGAMRGRGGDWQDQLVGLEPDDLAAALSVAGFDALEVDTRASADGGRSFVDALGDPDGASGAYEWWDLRGVPVDLDGADVDEVRAGLVGPPELSWGAGAERADFSAEPPNRLLGETVHLEVRNDDDVAREVRLIGTTFTGPGAVVTVDVGGRTFPAPGGDLDVAFTAAPGTTAITVHVDGPGINSPDDTRDLRGRAFGWMVVDQRTDPLWRVLHVPVTAVGRPAPAP